MHPRSEGAGDRRFDCSIIMPAHNREAQLPATLAALARQSFPASRFELLLVNDGSRDGTGRVAAGFRPRFHYRYLERRNTDCRAAARNIALRAARGEVILFLDAECAPPPGLVGAHVERHLRRGWRAIAGGFRLLRERIPLALLREDWTLLCYLPQEGKACIPRAYGDRSPLLVTAHASCRREDALAVGMFDESFVGYGGEDLDLGFRLTRAGIRIHSAPELMAFHQPHPRAPNREEQALKADLQVRRKHARGWRILQVLDPPDDPGLARRVAAVMKGPELAQYQIEVSAAGRAAAELRGRGIACVPPREAAGGRPHLVHLHTARAEDPGTSGLRAQAAVVTVYPATGGMAEHAPPGLPRSRAVRPAAMLAKLQYDSILCGARYPVLSSLVDGGGAPREHAL